MRLCICGEAGGLLRWTGRMLPPWQPKVVLPYHHRRSLDFLGEFCACASHTLPPRHTKHSHFTSLRTTSGWAASCPGQPPEEELEEEAMMRSFCRHQQQAIIIGRRGWKRS